MLLRLRAAVFAVHVGDDEPAAGWIPRKGEDKFAGGGSIRLSGVFADDVGKRTVDAMIEGAQMEAAAGAGVARLDLRPAARRRSRVRDKLAAVGKERGKGCAIARLPGCRVVIEHALEFRRKRSAGG